jgi:hypothetical protein
MKALIFILPSVLSAQILTFGVKGGLPLTSTSNFEPTNGRIFEGTVYFDMKRYTFGPTVEVKLPLGFRVEVDGLYEHLRKDIRSGPYPQGVLGYSSTMSAAWEIPMLLKRRFGHGQFAPYAAAGASLRHIGDLNTNASSDPQYPGYSPSFTHFTSPSGEPVRTGITAAGGVSIKTRFLRIEPELRYTHWTSDHYLATTEQFDFLVGITFSPRER